jgi:hypothetical protein
MNRRRGGAMNGRADTLIGPAAADVTAQGVVNIGVSRMRLGVQQFSRGHDHS